MNTETKIGYILIALLAVSDLIHYAGHPDDDTNHRLSCLEMNLTWDGGKCIDLRDNK